MMPIVIVKFEFTKTISKSYFTEPKGYHRVYNPIYI